MEYLGSLAPFYISRYRLKLLADRAGQRGPQLSGSLQIPGIGELHINHEHVDPATGALLERVVLWLAQNDAIGDPTQADCEYCWVWIQGKIAWVKDEDRGVDHLLVADLNARAPAGWRCLAAGSRANLTSLVDAAVPSLGSSPIAIQEAIKALAERTASTQQIESILRSRPNSRSTCASLLRATEMLAESPSTLEWSMAGLIEVVMLCPEDQLIVGAPLFLTYYSSEL